MSVLRLNGLVLETRLGWGSEERSRPQAVRFDLAIRFTKLPLGARTDELGGTVCYATLADRLRAQVTARDFRLIEHLAFEAHSHLMHALPPGTRLSVRVTKLKPPIEGLVEGASFAIDDAEAFYA